MSLTSMVCQLKMSNKSKRVAEAKQWHSRKTKLHITPDVPLPPSDLSEQGQWANLPPELLLDIIGRVDESETSWPERVGIVYCASVCKSWRAVTKEVVKTPEQCGRHISYLSEAVENENPKMLLAANRATGTEFIISLAANDFSQASNTYLGKLRSNILGTKFTVYDSQPPQNASDQPNSHSSRKFHCIQVSPKVPACNYNVAIINYEFNVLRTRGPRRMHCILNSMPISAIQEGGNAPTPTTFLQYSSSQAPKGKDTIIDSNTANLPDPPALSQGSVEPLVLKNKAPRWHEQQQCWCLNFRGRVTVASVKNFLLAAVVDPSHNVSAAEQEKVILQFGKIGKDIFSMDYRFPLSAFQAFVICLSSFDTKPGCE